MLARCLNDGTPVVLLEGIRYQIASSPVFASYKQTLAGLMQHNIEEVRTQLQALGITPSNQHVIPVQQVPRPAAVDPS